MSIPRHIFKQYDIRGLVGEEITEELAENIGRAYAQFLAGELSDSQEMMVVVGRDMRESSVAYQNRLMAGLVKSGVRVVDIGLVSTPAFYFGVGHLKADGGIMVSASHNPAAYNGFKLTRANAVPISGDTGIQEIAELVEAMRPLPASPYEGEENSSLPPLAKGGLGRVWINRESRGRPRACDSGGV